MESDAAANEGTENLQQTQSLDLSFYNSSNAAVNRKDSRRRSVDPGRHATYTVNPVKGAYPVVHGFTTQPNTADMRQQPGRRKEHIKASTYRSGTAGWVPHQQNTAPLAPVRSVSAGRAERPWKPKPLSLSLGGNHQHQHHKERFVPLPGNQFHIPEEPEDMLMSTDEGGSEGGELLAPGDPLWQPRRNRGFITVYCIAESFSRERVEEEMRKQHPGAEYRMYPGSIYLPTSFSANEQPGNIFIHDYGVAICWNLTPDQEHDIVNKLLKCCIRKSMPDDEVSSSQLSYHYSSQQPPHIQNDIITINKCQAQDHEVKLAISHALAQSSKLSVYEERIGQLVEEVRHLPEEMATYGEVRISRRDIAKLMGKVFLQKSAVNLLSTVLDTPEYFWMAPDHLQVAYDKVCEYLELEERVELVNARFEIIQKMLNIWSEHSQYTHISRLDAVIVLLIVIEVVLAAFQVLGLVKNAQAI